MRSKWAAWVSQMRYLAMLAGVVAGILMPATAYARMVEQERTLQDRRLR